jgi:hypothetical protein
MHPDNLSAAIGQSHVFSFCRRERNCLLGVRATQTPAPPSDSLRFGCPHWVLNADYRIASCNLCPNDSSVVYKETLTCSPSTEVPVCFKCIRDKTENCASLKGNRDLLLWPKSLGAKQGRGDNLLIQLVRYVRKYSSFNTLATDYALGVTKGVH